MQQTLLTQTLGWKVQLELGHQVGRLLRIDQYIARIRGNVTGSLLDGSIIGGFDKRKNDLLDRVEQLKQHKSA